MLTKTAFANEIERLIQFYPTWNIKCDDKATMSNWYKMFESYTNDEFSNAVTQFIKTSKFNPTVAGLIETSFKIQTKPIDQLTIDDVPPTFKHWPRDKDVSLEDYNRVKLAMYKRSLMDDN